MAAPATAVGDVARDAKPPKLDAAAWYLVDRRDGAVLAAHASHRRRAIASTTKLMTAHLALERLDFDRRVRMPAYDASPAESLAGLRRGERLTVRDLLHALLLASANDAAKALAVGTSGSVGRFVRRMNSEAATLGLRATHFANPIGLDQKGNFSTAGELAELADVLLADRRFRRIVSTPEYEMRSGARTRLIESTNTLMLTDPRVDGVKTGHTSDAGYVLIASAKQAGVSLLSVVMGAPSEAARDEESAELLDYGFSLYQRERPLRPKRAAAEVEVRYEDQPLALLPARSVRVSARADQRVRLQLDVPERVEGPIEAGERLGRAVVRLDRRVVGRSPLLAARAVAAPSPIDRIGGVWVLVAAIVIVLVILLLSARVVRGRGGRRDGSRSSEERARGREERARKRNGRREAGS